MQLIEIDLIKPYLNNAKKHPTKQIKQIANSIKEFGFNQPIVIDKKNEIIVGHGRYLAARELGLKTVPFVRLENLSKEQVKAYRLADNKLNESEWDLKMVVDELKGLDKYYLDLTGFSDYLIDLKELEDEEIDSERLKVIMIYPPESPKLKERIGIFCENFENYKKIKEAIKDNKITGNIILDLI